MRGRTIRSEVSAADLDQSLFWVVFLPTAYLLVCSHKGDLGSLPRSETEPSGESGWSKHLPPGREEPLPCPCTCLLRNLVGKFLPCEAAVIEGLPNSFKERVSLRSLQARSCIPG